MSQKYCVQKLWRLIAELITEMLVQITLSEVVEI